MYIGRGKCQGESKRDGPKIALENKKEKTIGLIKLLFYSISGISSNIKDLFQSGFVLRDAKVSEKEERWTNRRAIHHYQAYVFDHHIALHCDPSFFSIESRYPHYIAFGVLFFAFDSYQEAIDCYDDIHDHVSSSLLDENILSHDNHYSI